MTLHNKGTSKLIEESGELLQALGKFNAYPDQDHPDQKGNTKTRLIEEIADVQAIIKVWISINLNDTEIEATSKRSKAKEETFFRVA